MTKNKRFWVCLITKNNVSRLSETLKSIQQQIQKYNEEDINLLIVDKSSDPLSQIELSLYQNTFKKILFFSKKELKKIEEKHSDLYKLAHCDLQRDSIQRARIQLMLTILENREHFDNSIIWQIDDDLSFEVPFLKENQIQTHNEKNFFEEVRAFHLKFPEVDAAIGKCSFAPPLPLLLYIQKQLVDILEEKSITQQFELLEKDQNYHDLYSSPNGENCILPLSDKISYEMLIQNLLRGVPVTRPIIPKKVNSLFDLPKKSYLRGGNFIIFNLEAALIFPHPAFIYQGLTSRRSDMFHAWMLGQSDFYIAEIELSLLHGRHFQEINFPKMEEDYLADLLGALMFRFLLKGENGAKARFEAHSEHLMELSKIVSLLNQQKEHFLLEKLNHTVLKLSDKVLSWEWEDLLSEMKTFQNFLNFILNEKKKIYV